MIQVLKKNCFQNITNVRQKSFLFIKLFDRDYVNYIILTFDT